VMVTSASLDSVIEPSSTWFTNSFTRSRPRSRVCASRLNRPCETIWSSSEVSCAASVVVVAAASGLVELLITVLLLLGQLGLQTFPSFRARHGFEKHLVELVIAL